MEYFLRKKRLNRTVLFQIGILLTCFNNLDCQKLTEDTIALNNKNNQDTSNCTIKPALHKTYISLGEKIKDNNRLIELDIEIKWNVSLQNSPLPSSLDWFLTTSDSGKHLLLLPDNFTEKSLGTLSFGIAKVHLVIDLEPGDCLANITPVAADILLKRELLTLASDLNSNDDDEEDDKTMRICNGTSESGGSCCELSNEGNHIICEVLEHEPWRKIRTWIIGILAFIAVAQSISWIPDDMYRESVCHIFKLHNLVFDMNVLIANSGNTSRYSDNWKKVSLERQTMLEEFRMKLLDLSVTDLGETGKITITIKATRLSGSSNASLLQSEVFPSSGIFQFLYIFVKDKLKPCKLGGCCPGIVWSENDIIIAFVINVFVLPLLVISFENYLEYNGIVITSIAFILLIVILIGNSVIIVPVWRLLNWVLRFKERNGSNFYLTNIVKHNLRVTLTKESTSTGPTIPLFIRCIKMTTGCFPLIQFLFLVISNVFTSSKTWKSFLIFLAYLIANTVGIVYLFVIGIEFYVECLFCTILGLFLNYDDVFYFAVLLLIFIKFVNDSINDVKDKMEKFTRQVFKTIRELSKETQNYETGQSFFLQGDKDHPAGRFLFCDEDESVRLVLKGIAVFEHFSVLENIYIRHVHKEFIDKVASLPGHLTPGSTKSLLLIKCKEIISVAFILSMILIFLSTFSRETDVSGSVKTLITFITGTVSIIFARLWFENKSFPDDGTDVYYKELLKKYLASYEEQLNVKEFQYDITCTSGNESENDLGMIIENFDSADETWYIKPLTLKESFDQCEYLKRMFKGSYSGSCEDYEQLDCDFP